jgi:alanine dehydrogenase
VTSGKGVLLLTRSDVSALMSFPECVASVEAALLARSEGRVLETSVASVPAQGGGFHVKAGGFSTPSARFVAKINANFPGNPRNFGLPTIQGVLLLADALRGSPLAVIDSIEITIQRTGAATAIAAKFLARPSSRVGTVVGCGAQGRVQARALFHALPLERLFLCDIDRSRAESLALELGQAFAAEIAVREDIRSAASESDAVVTCTPSREALLFSGDLRPGAFLAAVGADSAEKKELDPKLLAGSRVIVDELDQCAAFGELHHAITAGLLRREDALPELADVVSGKVPGRQREDETIVFDSTGFALEDAAAAVLVYERALQTTGTGVWWNPTA